MQLSENFGFLGAYDAKLVELAALAERYFREDPATSIFKLRQFAELLSQQVAARHAVYRGERESFEEMLRPPFLRADHSQGNGGCARKLVDHLDQAIVAKAFRGELVPQDPNDEPASVLLERIRAEHSAADKTAGAKKRRSS